MCNAKLRNHLNREHERKCKISNRSGEHVSHLHVGNLKLSQFLVPTKCISVCGTNTTWGANDRLFTKHTWQAVAKVVPRRNFEDMLAGSTDGIWRSSLINRRHFDVAATIIAVVNSLKLETSSGISLFEVEKRLIKVLLWASINKTLRGCFSVITIFIITAN